MAIRLFTSYAPPPTSGLTARGRGPRLGGLELPGRALRGDGVPSTVAGLKRAVAATDKITCQSGEKTQKG